jgi:hypothetical protein
MVELQALLDAPTRPASPKSRSDLDPSRRSLLDLLVPRQSEEDTRPEPSTVTMPRSIRKFPELVLNCPVEDGDNSLATESSQQTISTSASVRLPGGFATNLGSSEQPLPMRFPRDTADMSVQMPRRDSLEGTRPLMLPDPYAHTVFFANGGFITFAEGVVPPHLDSMLAEQAAEESGVEVSAAPQDADAGVAVAGHREDHATSDAPERVAQTPSPTHVLNQVRTFDRVLSWADEMEDQYFAPQVAPWSAALPHGLERVPQNHAETPNGDGTPEPSITPPSPIQ